MKEKINTSKILGLIIVIWILGFTASYGYANRYMQIALLPIIVITSYNFIILIHEFIHFLIALILKIDTKGFSCSMLSLKYIDKKFRIRLKNPINIDLTGCTYINCGKITNNQELNDFKKKVFLFTVSAPIFNYIITVIIIYLNLISYQSLMLKGLLSVSIILSINVTIGDIYTAYLYIKNRNFLIYVLIETEIVSDSLASSKAKSYLINELYKSLYIFKDSNIDFKKHYYNLLNYNKMLYLCIADEFLEIDYEIFNNLKNYLLNLNFNKSTISSNINFNNADTVVHSMLYSILILNNDEYKDEFLQFIKNKKVLDYYTNKNLKNAIFKFINNLNIKDSKKCYMTCKNLDERIIKRIGVENYEKNSSLCRK